MCGIAAFSVPQRVNRNARALAHALLTQIENRGSHASGFAYVDSDGSTGVYKNPKPGSQLPLAELPRSAKAVILHTRYATQGSPQDNNNNHPVLSPDNRIALVHNGVISNDHTLRGELGLTARHGMVDSLVIPALIADQGVSALRRLSGYAAISWIDTHENAPRIHIAKLKQSPVNYTSLYDGTFVMASTKPLLTDALAAIGAQYGGVFELAEGRMISVENGFVLTHDIAPSMSYNQAAWRQHSSATSGGHGAPAATAPRTIYQRSGPAGTVGSEVTKGSEDKKAVNFGDDRLEDMVNDVPDQDGGSCSADLEAYFEDLEEWRRNRSESDTVIAQKALASGAGKDPNDKTWMQREVEDMKARREEARAKLRKEYKASQPKEAGDDTPMFLAADGDGNPQIGMAEVEAERQTHGIATRYLAGEGFFIVDHEGDMTHYPTLDDLERRLVWLTDMGKTEQDLFDVEKKINWVNHIWDMGSVDAKGFLSSWVEDMADIDQHESPAVKNLQYIREGVGLLLPLKGR